MVRDSHKVRILCGCLPLRVYTISYSNKTKENKFIKYLHGVHKNYITMHTGAFDILYSQKDLQDLGNLEKVF